MKKEKINSFELQRLVALKSNKLDYSEVLDQDIDNIKDISLSSKLINGKPSGIALSDIFVFENIENIIIRNFEIENEFLKNLFNLPMLKSIKFVNCTFENVDTNLFRNLPDDISFTSCSSMPLKYPKVKKIRIYESIVDFQSIDYARAEDVEILDSTLINCSDLSEYSNIKILNLDGSNLYDTKKQVLPNIKVSEKTIYTHAPEISKIDGDERWEY